MPKLVLVILILGIWNLGTTPVKAADTEIYNNIHTSANGDGASAHTSVTNNVNSDDSDSADCTTDVVTDSNGQHIEHHGNCEDVDIKNGDSSVSVSNHVSSSAKPQPSSSPEMTPTIFPSPTASESATPSANPVENDLEFNWVDYFKQQLERMMSIFK